MAINIAISPMIERLMRRSSDWCSACGYAEVSCICQPDLRDNSTVLRFVQSPTQPDHCQSILLSTAQYLIGREGMSLVIAVGLSDAYRAPVYLNRELARLSHRVRLESLDASGYDYEHQAWVHGGKYERCGHREESPCGCFGRSHAGENVRS